MKNEESKAPENFGHLNGQHWSTKKIDEWKFHSPIPLDGPQVAKLGPPIAHVNLEREHNYEQGDKFIFVATSTWFKEIRSRSFSDLEAKVKDAFQLAQLAVTELSWEEWLALHHLQNTSSR